MKILSKSIAVVLGLIWAWPVIGEPIERVWINAKINGKSVELAFDSGSSHSALTPQAVTKYGLKVIPQAADDAANPDIVSGITEEFTLTVADTKVRTQFLVINSPNYVGTDFDGLLGWGTLGQNLLQIEAQRARLSFLDELPAKIQSWIRVPLVVGSGTLDLQVPRRDRTNGVLCIDTGSNDGLSLSSARWQEWRASHPSNPITLKAAFTPSDGFFVVKEAWADEIKIGPLTFKEIPISQSGPSNSGDEQYEGTLGLAALARFDFIVDGKGGVAYLRPANRRVATYSHNRLGAVFVPADRHEHEAVAWVIQDSPAYLAGVRDGDILLQVDDVKVESWSAAWLGRFNLKAGTRLKLTLNREGKVFSTTATLRDIVAPSPGHKN